MFPDRLTVLMNVLLSIYVREKEKKRVKVVERGDCRWINGKDRKNKKSKRNFLK